MPNFHINMDQNYKKILRQIMLESLRISGAQESFILYGTDKSKRLHLPMKEWDRAACYGCHGKDLFGIPARIKVKLANIQKLFPVLNRSIKNGQVVENHGIIPFFFNRSNYFYREGIKVIMVPEVKKYISNTEKFIKVPIYSYDGSMITRLKDDLRIIAGIVRIGNSKNFVTLPIPQFGLLELNNIDPVYFKKGNEKQLKETLNQLTEFVNIASMAYFKQKGKYINERQRMDELLDKEILLRQMSKNLHAKEIELQRKTEALDKASRDKYRLELQSQMLSNEVSLAQQATRGMKLENESSLAAIAHTAKNFYMTQKAYNSNTQIQWECLQILVNEIRTIAHNANKKYRNLGQFPFWKQIIQRLNDLGQKKHDLDACLIGEEKHINRFMEYILAAMAFQRGREYKTEGKFYSSLLKVLRHIEITHHDRLKELGILFKYKNHTPDSNIRLNRIHHFHLQEDIFINLIMNSIQALQNRPKKEILIDTYLKVNGKNEECYEIHYRDNGIGIPYDKKELIFQGWSGGRISENDRIIEKMTERGIGGQTIWKRVTQAGGTISELGIPGEGAHFVLSFDKYKSDEENISNSQNQNDALRSEKIDPDSQEYMQRKRMLVVDDDMMIFSHIARIFDNDFNTSHATGYEEAWNNILSSEPPDIITLDLDLKAAERGEKILLDLKSRGYAERIPIIVVSGSDRAYDEGKLINLGAWGVVQKPVRDNELKDRVYQVLDRKKELIRQ